MMKNKSLVYGGVGAIALVVVLLLVFFVIKPFGPAFAGKWQPANQTSGVSQTLEFTSDRMSITGEIDNPFAKDKKVTIKGSAAFKVKEQKDDVYTLEFSDPKTEVSGENLSDEFKKSYEESFKKGFEGDNATGKIKLSSDKKELTLLAKDGSDGQKYTKK